MRREDIVLREAARQGEPQACLEMAARLFAGKQGFAQNFKLGLAYLQQELDNGAPAAIVLVAGMVPLEVLMAQNAEPVLAAAARRDAPPALLKLGLWRLLANGTCSEARDWLARSGLVDPAWDLHALDGPAELARFLAQPALRGMLDAKEALLAAARDALRLQRLADACRCIAAAAQLAPSGRRLAEAVSSAVQLAAASGSRLALPVALVEASLASRCARGEVEAQFGLGCALAGMPYGRLQPQALAMRSNLRRAAALLLRAADAGRSEAWLKLFEIASDARSAAGNQEAARFFLEKAASLGIVQARRILGALVLKEATCLETAEPGVHWLSKAADQGDGAAHALLETLVLPLPELPPAVESSIVERVRAVDAELGARLALARAFHLTRKEALNFNARRDVRGWGLLIPGTSNENPKGRLAPAVHEPMKAALHHAASFFSGSRTLEHAFPLQKGRTQRQVFEALSISDHMFFAPEIGRSWSHHGFGRHWAARAAPLLKELLD